MEELIELGDADLEILKEATETTSTYYTTEKDNNITTPNNLMGCIEDLNTEIYILRDIIDDLKDRLEPDYDPRNY